MKYLQTVSVNRLLAVQATCISFGNIVLQWSSKEKRLFKLRLLLLILRGGGLFKSLTLSIQLCLTLLHHLCSRHEWFLESLVSLRRVCCYFSEQLLHFTWTNNHDIRGLSHILYREQNITETLGWTLSANTHLFKIRCEKWGEFWFLVDYISTCGLLPLN